MSKYVQSGPVPTVKIAMEPFDGSDSWVEVKRSLRLGDRDAINARMVKPKMKTDPKTGEEEMTGAVELDTSNANTATLKQRITDWGGSGFTNEDGTVDEINEANIAGLDENVAKFLLKEIEKIDPRPVGPKGKAGAATPAGSTSNS
jgi:hypothetical protein